jgi:hypothetical protein
MRVAFALAVLVALGATARADDTTSPAAFHKGQFGVSARVGVGLRAVATYQRSDYCGQTDSDGNTRVCTGRSPVVVGREGAYGGPREVELLGELGLGLESEFASSPGAGNAPHALYLAPGARFFFSESEHAKLFVTAQLVFDFTDYKTSGGMGRGLDFGPRSLQGVWFDLHRSYGIYAYAAETATFSRWLSAQLEAGVGFQARYP